MKAKAMLFYTVVVIVGYLGLSVLIHYVLLPLDKIDYSSYFKPGDQLNSVSEGFHQTIISVDGEWVDGQLEIKPHAEGPPEHIHTEFDETFTVKEGVLSVLINGELKTVKAGESIFIPKGTPHKPFNETDQRVVVSNNGPGKSIPAKFAYYLKQLYPYMDSMGESPSTLKMMMQMSVYGNEMDTWIVGPPIAAQKAMRFILAPTARLFGFRNEYSPAVKEGRHSEI
jgi:quercetin dioxygenase-like cupin family protein